MKEVSVHHDPTVVGHHKSILEQAGIDCFIRNESTSASLGAGMLGLVQSPVFDPVLCIVDDARYDEAMALLKSAVTPAPGARPDWAGLHFRARPATAVGAAIVGRLAQSGPGAGSAAAAGFRHACAVNAVS